MKNVTSQVAVLEDGRKCFCICRLRRFEPVQHAAGRRAVDGVLCGKGAVRMAGLVARFRDLGDGRKEKDVGRRYPGRGPQGG